MHDWYVLPVLTGSLIRLEPLIAEHATGYLAALQDDEEVLRWVNTRGSTTGAVRTLDDARTDVSAALDAPSRLAYAQFDAVTGEFAGTTSYYEIDPALRTLAIGYTWLGRRWWRTGHNTESKLLLLTRAFDALGAVRVVWRTDIYNDRSQAAISRLGATREGELRKFSVRRDGSWRTAVQYSMTDDDWPAARAALVTKLAAFR